MLDIINKQLELGVVEITLTGSSMLPTYKPGDVVTVEAINRPIKVNDIVLFYDKKMVLHRVVKVRDGVVITRGDNNNYFDRPMHIKNLVGVVTTYKNRRQGNE